MSDFLPPFLTLPSLHGPTMKTIPTSKTTNCHLPPSIQCLPQFPLSHLQAITRSFFPLRLSDSISSSFSHFSRWGFNFKMMGSGLNLISIIVGFGMSATFILFVCTRIICGRSTQSDSPDHEIESRVDLEQQPESRASGLEPVLIAAMQTTKFDPVAFNSVEDAQCSICLGEYEEKEVLRIMPKCGHSFHRSCIDLWLRKQSTCPVCRLPLQESFRTKPPRPTTASGDQSFHGSEISSADHHSQHWLPPGPNHSEGNTSTT